MRAYSSYEQTTSDHEFHFDIKELARAHFSLSLSNFFFSRSASREKKEKIDIMSSFLVKLAIFSTLVASSFWCSLSNATRLSTTFYESTCPNVSSVVRGVVEEAAQNDVRIGAKIIRLHFHDCIVDGCDGSILLDNADGIESEKEALPNNNSALGFEVVDEVKAALENVCPGVVSCADILALASQILVSLAGGPTWEIPLGRRDSRTANRQGANDLIPTPFDTLKNLTIKFDGFGLDATDLVALSGGHTFGRSQCIFFRHRLYNFNNTGVPDPTVDKTYMETLRRRCPDGGDNNTLANFDPITPDSFDNEYFKLLQNKQGILTSDQVLYSTSGADTIDIVDRFADSQSDFFENFARSMIKLGNISPLTGDDGEIRLNCRRVN
ncbi:hypothetical protein I3843_13G148700 [Carya illinoinensis]|nr:hypothetical protein I3760_13G169100 [Carya illinoinensis]KAG7951077.1 hypothetical protein I3843_13G148700 [Carya illinoinensis]